MTETFDRKRPLYRAFNWNGARVWHIVVADNTPGQRMDGHFAEAIEYVVANSPWREGFEAAYAKHEKATIYANVHEPYEVPEDCTAVLRNVRLYDGVYGRFAIGVCFGDREGRFPDGYIITTSPVKSGPDADGIIVTRNNRYKLELSETNRGQA